VPKGWRDELAPDPLGGRMGGDVEMDQPPPVVSNEEEEDIQRLRFSRTRSRRLRRVQRIRQERSKR
jgi:hypothetical protein